MNQMFAFKSKLELLESHSESYGPRTYYNARSSDLTIAYAVNFNTSGEILTEKASNGRILQIDVTSPFNHLIAAREIYKAVKSSEARVLNIAGNGLYTFRLYGLNQELINKYVYLTLKPIYDHCGIDLIRSGGQTGADLAGIISGLLLGVHVIAMFPKGYRQRLDDGMDVKQSREEVQDTIVRYAERLKDTLTISQNLSDQIEDE